MDTRHPSLILTGIILASVAILVGLTWVNYHYVAQQKAGMNAFLPRWAGTRWFMIDGWSPYSEQTIQGVQELAYGRPASADEDQGVFLYPFYAVLIYAPFALIGDILLARALWMSLLEVSLFIALWASLSLTGWRPPWWIIILLFVFSFFWYHSLTPLLDSSVIILCLALISLVFLAIRSEQDVMAGFLLALAGIRLEVIILLVVFIAVWAWSHKRWIIVWSFLGVTALFAAIFSLWYPDWTLQYFRQVYYYFTHTFNTSPGGIIAYWLPGVGKQFGWALTVFMAGVLLWEWRAALRKDFHWFYWTAGLTLAASNLIGIRTALENFILLFPAVVLVLATWDERWGRLGRWLVVLSLLFFSFGPWAIAVAGARRGIASNINPWLFLFVPVSAFLSLYWVRWWALNPPLLPLHAFGERLRHM